MRRLLTLAGQYPVGPADASAPKGAFEILSRLSPVVHLLAIADGPVTAAKRAIRKLPPFGEPLMTFAAFEILRVASKGQPLTGVLEKTLMPLSVANRMALLMDLAPYIVQ